MYRPTKVTVLAIDTSWSVALRGSFEVIRDAALAIDHLASEADSSEVLLPLVYSAYAKPIERRMIADLSSDNATLGTNLHHALVLGIEMLHGYWDSDRRIVVLSDGEITAHLEHNKAVFQYPPKDETLNATLAAAKSCNDAGIAVRMLALDPNVYLQQDGARLAREAGVSFIACIADTMIDQALAAYRS